MMKYWFIKVPPGNPYDTTIERGLATLCIPECRYRESYERDMKLSRKRPNAPRRPRAPDRRREEPGENNRLEWEKFDKKKKRYDNKLRLAVLEDANYQKQAQQWVDNRVVGYSELDSFSIDFKDEFVRARCRESPFKEYMIPVMGKPEDIAQVMERLDSMHDIDARNAQEVLSVVSLRENVNKLQSSVELYQSEVQASNISSSNACYSLLSLHDTEPAMTLLKSRDI